MSAGPRQLFSSHPRQEFHRTVGFALYTDVNDALLDKLVATPIFQLPPSPKHGDYYETLTQGYNERAITNPAGFSLYAVTNAIVQHIPKGGRSFAPYGVTEDDIADAKPFTFDAGFDDTDTPWYFSAVLANEVVDYFIGQGKLTQEQKDQFTLHDWANILGSGWFSRLVHSMALTRNGIFQGFGRPFEDYSKAELRRKVRNKSVIGPSDELFAYSEQYEPDEDKMYATATLSKTAVNGLRRLLQGYVKTVGCPVARYSVLMSRDAVEHNPHVQNLIANGTLHVVPDRSDDTHVRLIQNWSAIDKTLALFGAKLDRYAATYGTPYLQAKQQDIWFTHEKRKPLGELSWPAETRLSAS